MFFFFFFFFLRGGWWCNNELTAIKHVAFYTVEILMFNAEVANYM